MRSIRNFSVFLFILVLASVFSASAFAKTEVVKWQRSESNDFRYSEVWSVPSCEIYVKKENSLGYKGITVFWGTEEKYDGHHNYMRSVDIQKSAEGSISVYEFSGPRQCGSGGFAKNYFSEEEKENFKKTCLGYVRDSSLPDYVRELFFGSYGVLKNKE